MNTVTIYTTPTCAFCHAAKEWMSSRKIEFKEVDLGHEPNAAQILIDKSGQLGVPVIDVAGTVVIGFNRPQLELLLRDKKLL